MRNNRAASSGQNKKTKNKDLSRSQLEKAARKAVKEMAPSYVPQSLVKIAQGAIGSGFRAAGQKPDSIRDSQLFSHTSTFDTVLVGTPGSFAVQSYLVHACNSQLFPLLSIFGSIYEKARFRKLRFTFESTTSVYIAGGAMGDVAIGWIQNPDETSYDSISEMMNSGKCKLVRPDKNIVYDVPEVDSRWLFSQNGYTQGNNAIGNWALGKLQVGVDVGSTFTAGAVLGRLKVEYTVEVKGMRLKPATISAANVIGYTRRYQVGGVPNKANGGLTAVILAPAATSMGIVQELTKSGIGASVGFDAVVDGYFDIVVPVTFINKGAIIHVECSIPPNSGSTQVNNRSNTGMNGLIPITIACTGPATPIKRFGCNGTLTSWTHFDACIADAVLFSDTGAASVGHRFGFCVYYSGMSFAPITMRVPIPYICTSTTASMDSAWEVTIYDTGGVIPVNQI